MNSGPFKTPSRGRPERCGSLDQVWQPAIEAAGYHSLGFHQLRHTAISLMSRAGYRPESVAERVGHADGGALILKRYRHLYPSESYAAAPSLDALVAER